MHEYLIALALLLAWDALRRFASAGRQELRLQDLEDTVEDHAATLTMDAGTDRQVRFALEKVYHDLVEVKTRLDLHSTALAGQGSALQKLERKTTAEGITSVMSSKRGL